METPVWIVLKQGEQVKYRVRLLDETYSPGYGSAEFFVVLPKGQITGQHLFMTRAVPDAVFESDDIAGVRIQSRLNYLDFAYLENRFDFIKLGEKVYITANNVFGTGGLTVFAKSYKQIWGVLRIALETENEKDLSRLKLILKGVEMLLDVVPVRIQIET